MECCSTVQAASDRFGAGWGEVVSHRKTRGEMLPRLVCPATAVRGSRQGGCTHVGEYHPSGPAVEVTTSFAHDATDTVAASASVCRSITGRPL